jgi:hypothetical protein
VSTYLYIEGGGDSKELHVRCRTGFRKLFENCGFAGRMPRLVACGSRASAFDSFATEHARSRGEFVAMLLDSEEPMGDVEATWKYLIDNDGWTKPATADDEQVLFMTTCMETWTVSDRAALTRHYGDELQTSALPPLVDLESRRRQDVQDALAHATRGCSNAYRKGKRSFELLEKLTPDTLAEHLPSFARARRILDEKL